MKIVIDKQTDKLGDEYLQQEDVIADIWKTRKKPLPSGRGSSLIEVDDKLYVIPFEIITCLEKQNSQR